MCVYQKFAKTVNWCCNTNCWKQTISSDRAVVKVMPCQYMRKDVFIIKKVFIVLINKSLLMWPLVGIDLVKCKRADFYPCQTVCFLRCFLSRSFKIGGSITKLLNQFDDWWFRKSKEIWVSILQNTTSAKWIMIMEIFWTP